MIVRDYVAIQKELVEKGFDVMSVKVVDGRTVVYFNCSKCGKPYQIFYENLKKGQNPKLLCKDCQVLTGPKMERIQTYFKSKNVPITRIDSSKKHWDIYFPCVKCGTEVKIIDDYVGKNNKELCCKHCRDHNTVPTQESIEKLFEERGSKLLSEYKNTHTPVEFKCTKCGGVGKIAVAHLKAQSFNRDLLCPICLGKVDSEAELKTVLSEKGSSLVGEFINIDTPVDVLCTRCRKPFKFSYGNFKYLDQNQDVICKSCRIALNQEKPTYVGDARHENPIDQFWMNYSMEFFNIFGKARDQYSAHHLSRYGTDLDRRTSFVNVYPLLKTLHVGNSHYYHYEDGMDITKWTGVEKLPYHDYSDFKFLDLNSKCVTEILWPNESMSAKFLYNRKKQFAEQGIFYIPFFFHELRTREQRQLAFSMIRARLYSWFPDIYRYTGTDFRTYYARQLTLKPVSYADASCFFTENHIQGSATSSVFLGLYTKDDVLVSCMGFAKPRSGGDYDYEITRFASLINSRVIGGASKLFKHFVDEYKPDSVVSFCDLRFSSLDPTKTVYSKLGFEYVGYSDPNYGYRDPQTGIVKSRRSYQKSMLEKLFADFDPELTEKQNMENHGYVMLFDCGNHKFVWRAK